MGTKKGRGVVNAHSSSVVVLAHVVHFFDLSAESFELRNHHISSESLHNQLCSFWYAPDMREICNDAHHLNMLMQDVLGWLTPERSWYLATCYHPRQWLLPGLCLIFGLCWQTVGHPNGIPLCVRSGRIIWIVNETNDVHCALLLMPYCSGQMPMKIPYCKVIYIIGIMESVWHKILCHYMRWVINQRVST